MQRIIEAHFVWLLGWLALFLAGPGEGSLDKLLLKSILSQLLLTIFHAFGCKLILWPRFKEENFFMNNLANILEARIGFCILE